MPAGAVPIFPPQEKKEKDDKPTSSALAAATAAGAPPREPSPPGEPTDADGPSVPAPEPEYVLGKLLDGRNAYCARSATIIVDGVGPVRLADIIQAESGKRGVLLSDLMAVPDHDAHSTEKAGPTFIEGVDVLSVERMNSVDVDSDSEESVAGGEEDLKEGETEEQKKQFFLDRRMAQEDRLNNKLERMGTAVIKHPGIKQPLDGTAAVCKGTGNIALKTKPKEVKVVCTLF